MSNLNPIAVVCADKDVEEVLGPATTKFKQILFYGGKGTAETPNTGTVYIQLMDENGAWVSVCDVPTGSFSPGFNEHQASKKRYYNAAEIRVKALNDGDGVVGFYS